MTVAELIEALRAHPAHAQVILIGDLELPHQFEAPPIAVQPAAAAFNGFTLMVNEIPGDWIVLS